MSARRIAEAMWARDRASQGLGMALEASEAGHARLSMRITEAMVNGHGICHGGFIFTLADSAMAFAANSHGEPAVAQHGAVTFLRPARLGQVLTAIATERARAGRSGIYDVTVAADDGRVLAEFRGQTRTIGPHVLAATAPPPGR